MGTDSHSTPTQDLDIREGIQQELESTRREFHQLLAQVQEEDLDRPSQNPAWTIRAVLYHMSLAPRNLPADVRMIQRFKWVPKLPAGPFDRLNAYLTRRGARGLDKAALADKCDQAHQRTLQALENVSDQEWQLGVDYPDWDPLLNGNVTLERLFHYIAIHFQVHAAEIKAVLASNDSKT